MFSIHDVCETLGISRATYINWTKEGVIQSVPSDNSISFDAYIAEVRKNLGKRLSSRANRLFSNAQAPSFHGINSTARKSLLMNILEIYEYSLCSLNEAVISLIICQLKTNNLLNDDWITNPKTRIEIDCKRWIDESEGKSPEQIISIFSGIDIPYEGDDFLGTFYQSAQCLGEKASKGSFYTPTNLLSDIKIEKNKSVYDPCCGSGNILLNIISKDYDSSLIYASDVDKIALKICEANLVLFFNNPDVKAHIFERSLLFSKDEKTHYDFIISNPPWGAKISEMEKWLIKKNYSFLKTTESFSICLYNASQMLGKGGKLYFFLPKSFLNVAAHKEIRKYLFQNDFSIKITLLGNVFSNVVSECILLELEKGKTCSEITVINEKDSYSISKKMCTEPAFIIPSLADYSAQKMLNAIYKIPHVLLKDKCDFALGIVTGDNGKYVRMERGDEKVYRGKNIEPYRLLSSQEYILFEPDKFQQIAPEHFYRERKIMYRFIANRPVCAISEKGELPLNSANVFIPRLKYPFETIVSLFNSSLYAKLFQVRFDSVKVLRSHLEELPLPLFSQREHELIKKQYDKIVESRYNQKEIEKMDSLLIELLKLE